ncbi:hypothetical protein SAMN02745194_00326 [Roseomonas rosea]|uniref:Lipoprotein n=1 Tax=Muricoccus roseus TaxID=198092 RepID=A0A1M6B1N1_9PROT|nr:hypothetical protein [Roseomonas rosea]SHI42577.1 hypothetical protein SAMN02745194_00326 [Roseomonas rosea]
MNRFRPALLLPALALGAGLAACAPYPAEPYYQPGTYGVAPAVTPGYAAAPYATPMPGYVGQAPAPAVGPGYAAAVDPYCREAYAAAAGAQQQAAISGSYADAARADRSAGFFRRDC